MPILLLLLRLMAGLASRWRNLRFRLLGADIGGYVWLRRIDIPRQWGDVRIDRGAALDDGVILLCSGPARKAKIHIGARTYMNRHTFIDAHESVTIGADCMIGPGCYITDGDHGTEPNRLVREQSMVVRPVIIGAGVWIGAGVKILKGVSIGAGAILGAGAVATKDIPAGAKAVGVPARVIGFR